MAKQKEAAQNMIGRQTNNTGFAAVPASRPVRVDGSLDEWDLSGQIESYADTSIKDTFSVKTAAMWDSEFLYLAFTWRDPYPMVNRFNPLQDKERGWMADSVQLRILADNRPAWITMWCYDKDKSVADAVYFTGSDFIRDRNQKDSRLFYTGIPGETELGGGIALAYRMSEDKKGFVQEVRLPWKAIFQKEHTAKAGEKIRLGLDFSFGQPDGSGRPLHSYCDNMQPGKSQRTFFWTATDSWGDLTLLDTSVAVPRSYHEGSDRPAGTIPLRCLVPADAKTFTVTVNTQDGKRIRNVAGGYPVAEYKTGEANGRAVVEVLWDGLDEAGRLVKPGEYVVSGITANGIDGYYESSFYNPGTPPWRTAGSKGGWGADHSIPHLLAAAGDGMVVCSRFAEGGYGTFLLETEGENAFTKRWSEIRGTDALAANKNYVFLIPNDWTEAGIQLLRLDVKDGSFVPFTRNGTELPMPYYLKDLFRLETDEIPTVTALAATDDLLLARCDDHRLRAIDPERGVLLREYFLDPDNGGETQKFRVGGPDTVENPVYSPMTTDGTDVYYVAGNRVYKMNLETGKTVPVPLTGIERISSIAIDTEGNLYVSDAGHASQIVKFTPAGEIMLRVGRFGGRPRQGKYERDGMFCPESAAIDISGNIWVTEGGNRPRRISVWTGKGEFLKEFIGNAGYSGQGTFIHTQDPDRAFAEFTEMVLDRETGKWEAENIMYHPDPAGGLAVKPGDTPFDSGSMFFSGASGKEREYYAVLGWPFRTSFFLMMKDRERWIPAAAMATVANLLQLYGGSNGKEVVKMPYGEWADTDPADMVFWNDYNNDGYVTRDECVIVPSLGNSLAADGLPVSGSVIHGNIPLEICSSASISTDDLSFYVTRKEPGKKPAVCRIRPIGYRDGGIPIYLPEGIRPVTDEYRLTTSAAMIPGEDLTIAFIEQDGMHYVAGLRGDHGEIQWKYLSPYHEVHGSHHAPMPRPGLLIGCLKVAGCAKNCGDSDVVMIRGNLGEDYFMTTDGMFIDILTHDERLPGIAFPDRAEELKKISFSRFPGRGEHFSGLFTRHWDGVIRCSGGLPACEAGNVIRIEGLESVRHYEPVTVTITDEDIVRADAFNRERALMNKKECDPLILSPVRNGKPRPEEAEEYEIAKKGQSVRGRFQGMYDETMLYLSYRVSGIRWVNGGNNWRTLFKTGDCVDFQCSPAANRDVSPAAGDFRLLIAPFQGQNTAVLMRQVDRPNEKTGERYRYSSPVADVVFDTVHRIEGAVIEVTGDENEIRILASIPWTELGMKAPAEGTELTGDIGIIAADSSGQKNIARIYRSNPSTNLVNDQPGEARLYPDGFGRMKFQDKKE